MTWNRPGPSDSMFGILRAEGLHHTWRCGWALQIPPVVTRRLDWRQMVPGSGSPVLGGTATALDISDTSGVVTREKAPQISIKIS